MRKIAYVLLFCLLAASLCSADPFAFKLTSLAGGVSFANVPGTSQFIIGFGVCAYQFDQVFQVCTTGNGSSLQFGDGTYGIVPNNGVGVIQATYSSGGGANGNISSGDTLGFFLNFNGAEFTGTLTNFRFTPICHPTCDLATLDATASVNLASAATDPTFDVNGLIEFPSGSDLVSLINSSTPQHITGSVVAEPASLGLVLSCLPLLILRRSKTRR